MAVFLTTDVLQAAYLALGQLQASEVSGGDTDTVIASRLANSGPTDDAHNQGVLFIVETTDDAAPVGEFSYITDYVASTGTFELEDALSATVTAGDRFAWASDFYPIDIMIEALNTALRVMGDINLVDTASISTAAAQSEYTYPLVAKRTAPYRVDIQTITTDANDNRWEEISKGAWEYIPAAPGSTALLILDSSLPQSRSIRFWYRDRHPYVSAFNDPIAETLDPETVVRALVKTALQWQNTRVAASDPNAMVGRESQADKELTESRLLNLPERPKKRPRLVVLGASVDDEPPPVPYP